MSAGQSQSCPTKTYEERNAMSMPKLAVLLVSAALIAGCAQRTKPDDEAARAVGPDDDPFATQPHGDDLFADGRPLDGEFGVVETPEALLGRTTIYFDFDASTIRSEYAQTVAAHAAHLNNNSRMAVRLEGHTDERGSREYNIGLGERRAQAVRRAMMLQGVRGDQISTVSYGEERPAVSGSDEEAWAMNRRVEIVYLR
jgi:peptidoglycan-associated lipoprotein